jgi:putative FmdB family regulatory protein
MPRYDYACANCDRRFEVVHRIDEDGPTSCPLCGKGPIRKAFAPPVIHFKGSGWAKKERRATSAKGSSSSDSGDGSGGSTDKGGKPGSSGSDGSNGSDGSSGSGGDGAATGDKPTSKDASQVSGSAGD